MNYKELLEHSFEVSKNDECPPKSRIQFLSQNIFDFTTYSDAMDEILGRKAILLCEAIQDKSTFEFIKNDVDHETYITMVNMKFFARRLDWGTSIRGAWWMHTQRDLESYGLYEDEDQIMKLKFEVGEWENFIASLIAFAKPEIEDNKE